MKSWPFVAGGAALVAFVVWLRERTLPTAAIQDPPSPKGPARWVELEGPQVFMFAGDVYRACVNVPGVVPNGFVMSQILKRAPGMGFRDVSVQEGPPAGFPKATTPGGDCNVFAQATWNGADGVKLARDPHITGAWRLARA